MLWLMLGILIGVGWSWLVSWSRNRKVRINWLVWFLLILALVAALSGVQNFVALIEEYEERAAWNIIPIYGLQALIPGSLAVLLLWWQTRKAKR